MLLLVGNRQNRSLGAAFLPSYLRTFLPSIHRRSLKITGTTFQVSSIYPDSNIRRSIDRWELTRTWRVEVKGQKETLTTWDLDESDGKSKNNKSWLAAKSFSRAWIDSTRVVRYWCSSYIKPSQSPVTNSVSSLFGCYIPFRFICA
jgi:hypothetical protein